MLNIKRLFFFPSLQFQVKSNDFGYRLSSPLSRLWDVYNPGRQKFIAPTLLLMLVFTRPMGDPLTASRLKSSSDQSHLEAATYCTWGETASHSSFWCFLPPEVLHFDK